MGFIKFIKDRKDMVKVGDMKVSKATYENLANTKGEDNNEQLKPRNSKNSKSK